MGGAPIRNCLATRAQRFLSALSPRIALPNFLRVGRSITIVKYGLVPWTGFGLEIESAIIVLESGLNNKKVLAL